MDYLMVTRFNNLTWLENVRWKEKNDYTGSIYNTPVNIKDNIPILVNIYVIEMNNETNKILGIGKIKNYVWVDQKYKIYSDSNYNRYTYKGTKHIDIENINTKNIKNRELIEKLENRLFKGKSHLKRGQGITRTSKKITDDYLDFISSLF